MQHADDGYISNQGDAARAARAANELLQVLLTDHRVTQAFSECRLSDPAGSLARLERLVSDELNLPYRWLAVLLAYAYVKGKGVSGEWPETEVATLPRGRQPKNDGDYIRRDVEWYYRNEIKVPRETSYSIAKIDLDMKGEAPNHGQVDTAIARTKALLSVFELSDGT